MHKNTFVDKKGSSDTHYDAVIIGAGQSGLFAAKWLMEHSVKCIVLEKGEIGQAWRDRFSEMPLFSSRRFSSLPGSMMPGDPKGFPTCAETARYFQNYAEHFSLPIRTRTRVESATKSGDEFTIVLNNGEVIRAQTLINATGSNQRAVVPDFAQALSPRIDQYNAEHFTQDTQTEIADSHTGPALVVGDGASGRFIAATLAAKHSVMLAKGQARAFPPRVLLGMELFWWLNRLRIAFADKHSLVAKILQKRNPVPCGEHSDQRLERLGVRICQRVSSAQDDAVVLANGERLHPKAVVWAVGYTEDTGWMKIPSAVNGDTFIEDYGVTPEKGLFMIGRKWLTCRASELIMGVEKDAAHVLPHVLTYLNKRAGVQAPARQNQPVPIST